MFRVRWEERALRELTDLWTRADSMRRQAITGAAHHIDEKLRRRAADVGESRGSRQRILFVGPLVITFRVEEDEATASVLTVRETAPAGSIAQPGGAIPRSPNSPARKCTASPCSRAASASVR